VLGLPLERLDVVRVEAGEQLVDVLLHNRVEGIRGDRETRRDREARLRQIAEVRALAADESDVLEVERAERDYVHVSRGS
jgi:hypothetical protein